MHRPGLAVAGHGLHRPGLARMGSGATKDLFQDGMDRLTRKMQWNAAWAQLCLGLRPPLAPADVTMHGQVPQVKRLAGSRVLWVA